MGRESHLLTHGVDVNFWRSASATNGVIDKLERPLIVFWGVIDRRMDFAFMERLSRSLASGTVVLAGPEQDPDPAVPPTAAFTAPARCRSRRCRVWRGGGCLVMPYVDQPVTRAMQPLKLKEYLATGKPVVVRDLPANREWAERATRSRRFAGIVCGSRPATPGVWRAARASQGERTARRGKLEGESQRVCEYHLRFMTPQSPPTILDARVLSGSGGGPDKTLIHSPPFLAAAGYRMLCAYLHDPADPGFELLNKKAELAGTQLISVADRGPLIGV